MREVFDSIPNRISATVDEYVRAIIWALRRWSGA
jgi:hypothetical protein